MKGYEKNQPLTNIVNVLLVIPAVFSAMHVQNIGVCPRFPIIVTLSSSSFELKKVVKSYQTKWGVN